ncbi:MAG: hypothetical protein CMF74_06385 [Maricaulis sp.]|jgi:SAM-dependent methyltransferase|nr:hypothetical protein [Maricaulis sp.]HAQ35208.1 hypothetical protein [Alphaproteobacteria bacterium]|tara:strand:- start:10 stop:699 length:690 start_codon:yes stop_codon:yes gene_type:complete
MTGKSDSWGKGNLGLDRTAFVRHHPSELMMRALFAGRYSGVKLDIGPDTRVLDMGAMYLNNLVPFHDRGAQCFGVEINDDMAAISREAADIQGLSVDVRTGSNRAIPHEDGVFDVVLGLNVIHYEDDTVGLRAALAEYARVTRPGGLAFVISAGPRHYLRANAERLGPNRYRITDGDFRTGQVMAYFDSLDDLSVLALEAFDSVTPGRSLEEHADAEIEFYYAIAMKAG